MMLRKYGDFYPYGGYMTTEGEIVHVGAKDADTDYPSSEDLITLLRTKFREMARARQCKIVAVLFDVRVRSIHSPEKRDAIQACVDHVDGYSVEVFFPYQVIKGEIVYGETYANEGKHEIFAKPVVQ
jgi:hypothetical protein